MIYAPAIAIQVIFTCLGVHRVISPFLSHDRLSLHSQTERESYIYCVLLLSCFVLLLQRVLYCYTTTIYPLQGDGCQAGKQHIKTLAIERAPRTSGVHGDIESRCSHILLPH